MDRQRNNNLEEEAAQVCPSVRQTPPPVARQSPPSPSMFSDLVDRFFVSVARGAQFPSRATQQMLSPVAEQLPTLENDLVSGFASGSGVPRSSPIVARRLSSPVAQQLPTQENDLATGFATGSRVPRSPPIVARQLSSPVAQQLPTQENDLATGFATGSKLPRTPPPVGQQLPPLTQAAPSEARQWSPRKTQQTTNLKQDNAPKATGGAIKKQGPRKVVKKKWVPPVWTEPTLPHGMDTQGGMSQSSGVAQVPQTAPKEEYEQGKMQNSPPQAYVPPPQLPRSPSPQKDLVPEKPPAQRRVARKLFPSSSDFPPLESVMAKKETGSRIDRTPPRPQSPSRNNGVVAEGSVVAQSPGRTSRSPSLNNGVVASALTTPTRTEVSSPVARLEQSLQEALSTMEQQANDILEAEEDLILLGQFTPPRRMSQAPRAFEYNPLIPANMNSALMLPTSPRALSAVPLMVTPGYDIDDVADDILVPQVAQAPTPMSPFSRWLQSPSRGRDAPVDRFVNIFENSSSGAVYPRPAENVSSPLPTLEALLADLAEADVMEKEELLETVEEVQHERREMLLSQLDVPPDIAAEINDYVDERLRQEEVADEQKSSQSQVNRKLPLPADPKPVLQFDDLLQNFFKDIMRDAPFPTQAAPQVAQQSPSLEYNVEARRTSPAAPPLEAIEAGSSGGDEVKRTPPKGKYILGQMQNSPPPVGQQLPPLIRAAPTEARPLSPPKTRQTTNLKKNNAPKATGGAIKKRGTRKVTKKWVPPVWTEPTLPQGTDTQGGMSQSSGGAQVPQTAPKEEYEQGKMQNSPQQAYVPPPQLPRSPSPQKDLVAEKPPAPRRVARKLFASSSDFPPLESVMAKKREDGSRIARTPPKARPPAAETHGVAFSPPPVARQAPSPVARQASSPVAQQAPSQEDDYLIKIESGAAAASQSDERGAGGIDSDVRLFPELGDDFDLLGMAVHDIRDMLDPLNWLEPVVNPAARRQSEATTTVYQRPYRREPVFEDNLMDASLDENPAEELFRLVKSNNVRF